MRSGFHDLTQALRSLPLVLYFAWGDTRARYRRSYLGPFWIVLGTAIGVVGLAYLWSGLLNTPRATLVPALTVGLIVWQCITGVMIESPMLFVRNAAVIRNIRTSLVIFPLQLVLRHLINLVHHSVIIVVVLIIFPPPLSWIQLMVIPGIMLLAANLLWFAVLLGMLGARFRDIEPLVTAVVPMLFFLSPVIFPADHPGVPSEILWANPLTYLIMIVREPLEGVLPAASTYGVAVAMLVMGWVAALAMIGFRRHRLSMWV